MNLTSRLAVQIKHLPDWEFKWADAKPLRSRESLDIADILPTEHDFGEEQYIMWLTLWYRNTKSCRNYNSLSPREPQFIHFLSLSLYHGVLLKDENRNSFYSDKVCKSKCGK